LRGAPVFEIGPSPPFIGMEAGGGKQKQEEQSHSLLLENEKGQSG